MTSRRRSAFATRAALCGALALAAAATTLGAAAATPIVVRAGGRSFAAVVEDTETGRAFLDMLPLTLEAAAKREPHSATPPRALAADAPSVVDLPP